MSRHFQYIQGLRQLAIAYLAMAGGISAFLMRSFFPLKIDVLISNGLYCASNILIYLGIASLLMVRRPRLKWPIVLATLSTLALAFAHQPGQIGLRIVILSVADALIRVFLFVLLLRHLGRGAAVKALAFLVGLHILALLLRIFATYRYGAPVDVFRYNAVQSAYIAVSLITLCGVGVFSLALAARTMANSLEQRAHIDSLTGVLNRVGIETRSASELQRAHRAATPLCLAVLDIDDFKAFNSHGGHALGDQVLRQIAACINRNLRGSDACGRIGGDEFVLIFPNVRSSEASVVCRRILHAIETLPGDPAAGPAPTVSIGLTQADRTDSLEQMLIRADRALFAAKHSGKNCIEIDLSRALP